MQDGDGGQAGGVEDGAGAGEELVGGPCAPNPAALAEGSGRDLESGLSEAVEGPDVGDGAGDDLDAEVVSRPVSVHDPLLAEGDSRESLSGVLSRICRGPR